MRNDFKVWALASIVLTGLIGLFWHPFLWVYCLVMPLVLLGIYDMFQTKHAIMRTFPLVGRGRYWMEWLRPKIYQYFVESDIDGRPFNRTERSIVYQRAKKEVDSTPFGTQLNVYEEGYEWMNHSIAAKNFNDLDHNPRVIVGGPDCKQPYSASVYNVSAMSFGSLSINAVLALNGGAKIGNFAQNTGEGGLSDYHKREGGDVIYQFGTGYFGCSCRKAQSQDTVAFYPLKKTHPKLQPSEELSLAQKFCHRLITRHSKHPLNCVN
jgi:glutamate synthase domain-containing protein 2